jgi:hypothetical protein
LDTTQQDQLDRLEPFFRTVKIYHFSRPVDMVGQAEDALPHYAEYTLVNPIITAFDHDGLDYTSGEGNSNRMTIEYETVLYSQGVMKEPLPGRTGNQVDEYSELSGFKKVNDSYRDRASSPLGNPTASILGTTGLLNTAAGLLSGDVSPLGAALTVGKTVATWKQAGGVSGLINSATQEARVVINGSLTQIQQNAQSGNKTIAVPTALKNTQATASNLFNKLKSLRTQ